MNSYKIEIFSKLFLQLFYSCEKKNQKMQALNSVQLYLASGFESTFLNFNYANDYHELNSFFKIFYHMQKQPND